MRDLNRTFEELGAFHGDSFTLTDGGNPERVSGGRVSAGFFRALGGALGAAVLGAVFAARAGTSASGQGAGVPRPEVVDGVQTVFLVAAPLAALGLLVVLLLHEVPLASRLAPARG